MNRRLPHSRPTPTLTKGDDLPQPSCVDNFWPFDEMLEHKPDTRHYLVARHAAAELCAACPLTRCDFAVRGAA